MSKTILIAGGSGLIGSFLTEVLRASGHLVRILTRNERKSEKSDHFLWDPETHFIEADALPGVEIIINLMGDSIAGGRWTSKRKARHFDSRISSTEALLKAVEGQGIQLDGYIGASAVGIYGDRGTDLLEESSKKGEQHYLVKLCEAWESAHAAFRKVSKHLSIIRIGVVLTNEGGALPEMRRSVLLGMGAYFGSGKQYMPWIHIEDLVRIFDHVIERPLEGVINGASPNPVTNYDFMKSLVSLERGPGWLLSVPSPLLKLLLGEMSSILLQSQRVTSSILQDSSFEFAYHSIQDALVALRETSKK